MGIERAVHLKSKHQKMITMIEIKAGELMLKVPHTREGIVVVKAMVNLLEGMLTKKENLFKAMLTGGSDLNPDNFVATGNTADLLHQCEVKAQAVPATPFSPVKSSPKQRIKFRDWEGIAKTKMGTIYKEVVNRFLEEYKDGIEPGHETLSSVIREMYGEHLKKSSIATYVSVYMRYIRENKLAIKHPKEKFKPKTKDLLPMVKVIEIWNLLPDEFEYKQVKALVPIHIMQSAPRIDTTNFLIKQFLDNIMFECEETSPGVFKKNEK